MPDGPALSSSALSLLWAARLAQILAALAAVLLARQRRDYRPTAVFLVAMTAANGMRVALLAGVLEPAWEAMTRAGLDPEAVPFTGARALAAVALDRAAFLTWPAGLAALAVTTFSERRRRWLPVVAAAWALASTALFLAYPVTRGPLLARCYAAAELVALAVAVGAVVHWIWRIERPRLPHVVALFIFATEGAGLAAGAWRRGVFARWPLTQVQLVALYLLLVALEIHASWKTLSSPSDPSS